MAVEVLMLCVFKAILSLGGMGFEKYRSTTYSVGNGCYVSLRLGLKFKTFSAVFILGLICCFTSSMVLFCVRSNPFPHFTAEDSMPYGSSLVPISRLAKYQVHLAPLVIHYTAIYTYVLAKLKPISARRVWKAMKLYTFQNTYIQDLGDKVTHDSSFNSLHGMVSTSARWSQLVFTDTYGKHCE